MWIGWSIAIISASIVILAIIILVSVYKHEKKLYKKSEELYVNSWTANKEERAKYETARDKAYAYRSDIADWICGIMIGLFAVALLIGVIVGIVHEVQPKHELIQFEETKAIVEQAYENGTGFDNVAITQMVIEKNQWIADVKASLRKYGKWSIYWGFDIDSVEPIVLHKQGD